MGYFMAILEKGHMGAGNGYEVKRYFKGKDMLSVISKIRYLPRVKKRHTIESVKFIKAIEREEYIRGKVQEYSNPYLSIGFKGVYICPICGENFNDLFSYKQHIEKFYGVSLNVA